MTEIKTFLTISRAILARANMILGYVNRFCTIIAMIALVITSCLLTYSVVTRYVFKVPTDWQDEISMFLLFGAIFLSAASVQSVRGHVGIEFLEDFLSPRLNRIRLFSVDLIGTLFCGFFSWKTWEMLKDAIVEGKITTSTWGAPLWIPYGLMTLGMGLLALQLLLQTLNHFVHKENE